MSKLLKLDFLTCDYFAYTSYDGAVGDGAKQN